MEKEELELNMLRNGANLILIQSYLNALVDVVFAQYKSALGESAADQIRAQFQHALYDYAALALNDMPAESQASLVLKSLLQEIAPHVVAQHEADQLLSRIHPKG